jgi:hypothetical protein
MIEGNQVAMSADSVGHNTAWTLDIIDVASPCSAAWEGMRGSHSATRPRQHQRT